MTGDQHEVTEMQENLDEMFKRLAHGLGLRDSRTQTLIEVFNTALHALDKVYLEVSE